MSRQSHRQGRAVTPSPTTPSGAPLKVTPKLPPEAWQGSACRAGADVTPSCHPESPPGSAFLGFLPSTEHLSLLGALVTAPGPDRPAQGGHPAPGVPGLQDAATCLCSTPAA